MEGTLRRFGQRVLPALLAELSGCGSTELAEPVPVAAAASPTAAVLAPLSSPASSSFAGVKAVTVHPLDDPKSGLVTRSVFFDFGGHLLQQSDRALLAAHAKYLRASRSALVRIEGNCDERGGREYNFALGQKRAEAVRAALSEFGVPEDQMETISFGSERPVDTRHQDAAWAKNRRAYLNYVRR